VSIQCLCLLFRLHPAEHFKLFQHLVPSHRRERGSVHIETTTVGKRLANLQDDSVRSSYGYTVFSLAETCTCGDPLCNELVDTDQINKDSYDTVEQRMAQKRYMTQVCLFSV
jgi:hypothetical protein